MSSSGEVVSSKLVGLALCAAFTAGVLTACSAPAGEDIRYETLDGAGALVFDDGVARRLLDESLFGDAPYESLATTLVDCGNAEFTCLSTAQSVFAVPQKKELSQGLRYEVGGAVLRVLKCYDLPAERACSVALIESECQKFTDTGQCQVDPNVTSDSFAQATYFLYNATRGVMAFGVVPINRDSAEMSEQAFLGIVSQCVLKNRLGLLKAKIETSPSS